MNYHHAYHAGNFTDVLKHIVLTRIIIHLQLKDKAFRVFDTHAGTGRYDLGGEMPQKTGEWRNGIGRLLCADVPAGLLPLISPYLDLMEKSDAGKLLSFYPGSPLIARKLLRKQDRLALSELHPKDAEQLRQLFSGDYQVRVNQLDGWLALGGHLPPKEKRGMVLVDPPFEQPGEFERLETGLASAHKRWAGGTYCLWYPVKDRRETDAFARNIQDRKIRNTLRIELHIKRADSATGLNGCGLIIVNPPYTLEAELKKLLPWLVQLLKQGDGAGFIVEHLSKD